MESHVRNIRLIKTQNNQYYVSLYFNSKRYRFSNGETLGEKLYPNRVGLSQRQSEAYRLLLAFETAFRRGWCPISDPRNTDFLERLRSFSPCNSLSSKYRKALINSRDKFLNHLESRGQRHMSTVSEVQEYLTAFPTPSTFNHERKRLSVIIERVKLDSEPNPISKIKRKREKQELHKPFKDVSLVLEDIRKFNRKLHLCCLLTYGCLLRPHQEIRNLRWSDFSEDLSFISLSGRRNKSGRNRIVPVSDFIKEHLARGVEIHNMFSDKSEPYGEDYFKLLWRRYKNQSDLIEGCHTLYSFRHTGAINVFEKTKDLGKLQMVMGHSNLNVTLTYLRGLELPSLAVEDMPEV